MLLVLLALVACGDDGSASDAREDQVREAAEEAGLPDEVVDVLELAARGVDGTFQVTYAGRGRHLAGDLAGAAQPAHRRGGRRAAGREPGVPRRRRLPLRTTRRTIPPARSSAPRAESALGRSGAVHRGGDGGVHRRPDRVARRARPVRGDADRSPTSTPTCLVAAPKPGPTDGTGPDVETICLSDEGAQLLVDAAGDRAGRRRATRRRCRRGSSTHDAPTGVTSLPGHGRTGDLAVDLAGGRGDLRHRRDGHARRLLPGPVRHRRRRRRDPRLRRRRRSACSGRPSSASRSSPSPPCDRWPGASTATSATPTASARAG